MVNFVILFVPVPIGMSKTAENINDLLKDDFESLGIDDSVRKKFYTTTDEGSNVGGTKIKSRIGGENHHLCLCHLGSTVAKRSTRPYKKSELPAHTQRIMKEVDAGLSQMEKLVNKLR